MFTDDKITEIFIMCDEFSQKFDEFFKKTSIEAPDPCKRPFDGIPYIYTFLNDFCAKRPVFATAVRKATMASRQRTLFD